MLGSGAYAGRMFAGARNASGQALDLADRHASTRDFLREIEALRLIADSEKGAGVAGGDLAFFDEVLN